MAGVAHEDVAFVAGGFQADEFARVEQFAFARLRCHVGVVAGTQCALGAVFFDEALNEAGDALRVAFTGHLRHEIAFGVDERQRGPRSGGVGLPGHEVGVVEHDVLHLVALNRLVDGFDGALEFELRRVHADHHELVVILFFNFAQFIQNVQAVDAAERPEVQQNDLAAQILQRKVFAASVDPAAPHEFGCAQTG